MVVDFYYVEFVGVRCDCLDYVLYFLGGEVEWFCGVCVGCECWVCGVDIDV